MIRLVKESAAASLNHGQGTREQDLRSFLGMFNFGGDMVKQTVGSMSGGEKARLVLCMIVWQRPNLLLLDEPTNHLDLATREALSVALNEFEGTVMLVSHDRALLRAVCDEFWLVSRGGVAPFDGDLDDYQRYLLDEAKRQREEQREEQRNTERAAASARAALAAKPSIRKAPTNNTLRNLQRDLDKLEQVMAGLTAEQSQIEQKFTLPEPQPDSAALGKRLKVLQQELTSLEEQWLEMNQAIEDASRLTC